MHFFRAALGSLGVQFVGVLASFLVALLLARALGPEGYGVYAFYLSVIVILSIPIQNALPILVVRKVAQLDYSAVSMVLRKATRFILYYSTPFFFMALVWCVIYDSLKLEVILVFGVLLSCIQALTLVRAAALRGLGHIVLGQLPETVLRPLVFLVIMSVIVFWGAGINNSPVYAMGLHMLAGVAALLFVCIALAKVKPPAMISKEGSVFPGTNSWFAVIFPLTCVAGLQVVNQQVDILLLGFWVDYAEVGVYRVAVQLSFLVGFGLVAINQMLHPQFARLHSNGSKEELQSIVTLSSRVITVIALLAALVFWGGGEFLIYFFFGEKYQGAYVPLIILVAGQVANALFGSVGALLNMTGHERDTMVGMCMACVVNFLLGLVLIPFWGMVGAAIASASSFLVWNLVLWRFVRKRLQIESTIFFRLRE